MGIGEQDPAGGQAIHVGSFGLRVSSETANPVVEIIDRDEKDVGFLQRIGSDLKVEKAKAEKNEGKVSEYHGFI